MSSSNKSDLAKALDLNDELLTLNKVLHEDYKRLKEISDTQGLLITALEEKIQLLEQQLELK